MKETLAEVSHESVIAQSQYGRLELDRTLGRRIPVDHVKAGKLVFSALLRLRAYIDAKAIAVYLSMPTGEIQTDAIVRHAFQTGKLVYVPYLYKSKDAATPPRLMNMVRLKDLHDYESLKPDRWGIPSVEPASVADRQHVLGDQMGPKHSKSVLDMILMPGVAFGVDPDNGSIRRLGHGRGFYDFFIHRYIEALPETPSETPPLESTGGETKPPALLYGLALKEQFLLPETGQTVPVGPQDQLLDCLVVGNGQTIDARPLSKAK